MKGKAAPVAAVASDRAGRSSSARGATDVAIAAGLLVAVLVGGAGAGGCAMRGGASAAPDEPPPVDTLTQIRRGEKIFGGACAGCHGALGQGGTKGPAVTGMRALPLDPPPRARHRRMRFVTARDVYDFLRSNMPPNDPSSLSEQDRVAVVTYQLSTGPTDIGPRPLTLDSLSILTLRH
jgi:mono/diheme cytochrome c family protein